MNGHPSFLLRAAKTDKQQVDLGVAYRSDVRVIFFRRQRPEGRRTYMSDAQALIIAQDACSHGLCGRWLSSVQADIQLLPPSYLTEPLREI